MLKHYLVGHSPRYCLDKGRQVSKNQKTSIDKELRFEHESRFTVSVPPFSVSRLKKCGSRAVQFPHSLSRQLRVYNAP